nr:MAG TPA: hypothetical protein [Caudoviricetes sp.]
MKIHQNGIFERILLGTADIARIYQRTDKWKTR